MSTSRPMRFAAAGLAAVAVALGAYALGNSNSNNGSSGTANAAPFNQTPSSGSGQLPQQNGAGPPGGFGTPVTGATAQKVAAAALARYSGTVERVVKLSDGTYVAHVISSNGEYHVTVSKDFKVTGAQQGGPPAGGAGGARGGSTSTE